MQRIISAADLRAILFNVRYAKERGFSFENPRCEKLLRPAGLASND
jgi:hypothetical protein